MPYAVEWTDTFGGEANYSWVRRATIAEPNVAKLADFGSAAPLTRLRNRRNEQRAIMRAAKAAVGITGLRGVTTSFGDGYEFRPYSMACVMFVQWIDREDVE